METTVWKIILIYTFQTGSLNSWWLLHQLHILRKDRKSLGQISRKPPNSFEAGYIQHFLKPKYHSVTPHSKYFRETKPVHWNPSFKSSGLSRYFSLMEFSLKDCIGKSQMCPYNKIKKINKNPNQIQSSFATKLPANAPWKTVEKRLWARTCQLEILFSQCRWNTYYVVELQITITSLNFRNWHFFHMKFMSFDGLQEQ